MSAKRGRLRGIMTGRTELFKDQRKHHPKAAVLSENCCWKACVPFRAERGLLTGALRFCCSEGDGKPCCEFEQHCDFCGSESEVPLNVVVRCEGEGKGFL